MTTIHAPQRLLLTGLQKLTRAIAARRGLRPYFWKYIVMLREYYSRVSPPWELPSSYEDGIKITTSLSSHIESQIFWQGFQEADEGTINYLKSHLPENGVFIDIGANVGTFTLVGAKLARHGMVHAFEPSEYHFQRLSRNIAMNGFKNVHLNKLGLFDKDTEASLFLPMKAGKMSNTGAASLFRHGQDVSDTVERVRLIRLDDYVETHGLERIDLIKVDIEGAELNALGGARTSLKKFRPIVLMELDVDILERAGYTPSQVFDFWKDMDYRVQHIHNSGDTRGISDESELSAHQNIACLPVKATSVRRDKKQST